MAFLWLGGLGTANAILVKGSIDPAFSTSGALADLYWTALIQFDLGSSCLLSPNSTFSCSVSNLSVTGTLQDKPSVGTPGPILNVDFLSHDSSPPTLLSLAVDGSGQIIGIGSGPIGYASVDMRPSLDIGNAWIQFFVAGTDPKFPNSTLASGGLIVQPCASGSGSGAEEDNESDIAQDREREDDACNAGTVPAGGLTSSVLGVMQITQTQQAPEPGSLWLVLGALLASAPLLARRQQQR